MSKGYLLGLDGGGTKTEVLLCTAEGQVVGHAIGGPSSLTGQREEDAFSHIRQTLEEAMAPLGGLEAPIAAYYAGISGAGLPANQQRFRKLLQSLLPGAEQGDVGSDAVNALSAGIGGEDGIIAIAGTGSSVFARREGIMHQVGGWGYLLGDEGSGFDLGRRALMAALRCLDGRGPQTTLLAMCQEKAGSALRQWIPDLYSQDTKARIASFAPVLLSAAQGGDEVAMGELRAAAADMALAIRHAGQIAQSHQVVLGGSVWKDTTYRAQVRQLLPGAWRFLSPQMPPVYGAVVLAAGLAGIPWNAVLEQKISEALK